MVGASEAEVLLVAVQSPDHAASRGVADVCGPVAGDLGDVSLSGVLQQWQYN